MLGAEEGRLVVGFGGWGAMPAGLLSGGAVVVMFVCNFFGFWMFNVQCT